MMADLTGIFKSTVKMLKVRHKDISSIKAGASDSANATLNLKKPKVESSEKFSEKTKGIVDNITSLRTLLLKNRKAYMAASSNIPQSSGVVRLTEAERDRIDADAMSYIKLCNETLTKYKNEVLHRHLSSQHREHRMMVISMVEEYLKVVCQLYSEQRAIRVKRAVERQKMSRLGLQSANLVTSRSVPDTAGETESVQSTDCDATSKTSKTSKPTMVFDEFEFEQAPVPEVTGEEAQLFKQENEQLYNDMNSTLDEVRQIEGKVVEISRLQNIFTEQVLEQDTDISRIGDAMVHSTENIVQGNDDIREAMKNNAGMRVWIIFGICVLSFTLLFLDWYND